MTDYSKLIKEAYDTASKRYTVNPSDNKGKTPESFYRSPMYKYLIGLNNKTIKRISSGPNKDYFKHIYITQGDYSKRKGYEGSIYQSMKSQTDYIIDYVKSNPALRYTILGVYCDLWALLNNDKWKMAFKKAFSLVGNGKKDSMVESFRLLYVSAVMAFESIAMKIVDFKFSIYSGVNPITAISNLQNSNSGIMKHIVIPAIDIVVLAMNTKIPMNIVDDMTKDENAGLKAAENWNPNSPSEVTLSEEGLIGDMFRFFGKHIPKLYKGLMEKFPWVKWVAVVALVIAGIIAIIPSTRSIIYFVSMQKSNFEENLEIQKELLENNISELKERLYKTSDPKERDRIQKIIDKQIDMKNNLEAKLSKNKDDEIQAELGVQSELDDDSESTGNEVNDTNFNTFQMEI